VWWGWIYWCVYFARVLVPSSCGAVGLAWLPGPGPEHMMDGRIKCPAHRGTGRPAGPRYWEAAETAGPPGSVC